MYVTHDQIEAMTLADQIVVLKDGVVQQIGTPVEIYERPANRFVAGFFGTPTMNFLAADVDRGRRPPRGARAGLRDPARARRSCARRPRPRRRVVIGIRPERLSLAAEPGLVALGGEVAMREVLGAEVVLHVESPAGPLTVRADTASAPRRGDKVEVWLDPKAIHVFDARHRGPAVRSGFGLRASAVLGCLLALLVACGGSEARGITLWHAYTGTEKTALEASAARWNAQHPDEPLTLVAIPYGAFADKLTSAIPGGNGPDLFIYEQDRIGNWVDDGVIEPIEFWVDDARADALLRRRRSRRWRTTARCGGCRSR